MSDDTERLNATLAKLTRILAAVADHHHDDVRLLIDELLADETRLLIGQLALLAVTLATAGGLSTDELTALLTNMELRLWMDGGDGR